MDKWIDAIGSASCWAALAMGFYRGERIGMFDVIMVGVWLTLMCLRRDD